LSEVIAAVQEVPGVVAVDVNAFGRKLDDAVIGTTPDGIITGWNEGAEGTYGYSPEEAVGRSIYMLAPSERSDEVSEILEKIRQGQEVADYETVFVARDGRRLDVSLAVSPVKNPAGVVVDAAMVARVILGLEARLDAGGPQVGAGGAELLTLNPAPLSLGVM
jgi:PAS domain S-box-containing protein